MMCQIFIYSKRKDIKYKQQKTCRKINQNRIGETRAETYDK